MAAGSSKPDHCFHVALMKAKRKPSSRQGAKPFVSDEILFECSLEADGCSISRTELRAIYLNISQAISFTNRLEPTDKASDLIQSRRTINGSVEEWSELGREFIKHLNSARVICAELSAISAFAKPHPCIQSLFEIAERFDIEFKDNYSAVVSSPREVGLDRISQAFNEFNASENVDRLKRLSANSRRKCNKVLNSFKTYLKALLKKWKRVLMVRLDLFYRQEFARNYARCTHQRIAADRVKFLDLIRRNYPDFVGYAWKLEVGLLRRWHLHTLLCFNARNVWRDVQIGRTLGERWKEITEGEGNYFNCNGKRTQYKFDAIGEVRVDDAKKIGYLIEQVVPYMTKPDYVIGVDLPDGGRSFGKGQIQSAWLEL